MKWNSDRHAQKDFLVIIGYCRHLGSARFTKYITVHQDDGRFLFKVLVELAGTISHRQWNAAIAAVEKSIADQEHRLQRMKKEEQAATLPNPPSPREDAKDATGGQDV